MNKKWSQLVQKGTPNHGQNLCEDCEFHGILRGHAESQEIRRCNRFHKTLKFKVVQCTEYRMEEEVPLYTMEAQAYVMVIRKDGRKGWLSPMEARAYREQNGEDDEDDE